MIIFNIKKHKEVKIVFEINLIYAHFAYSPHVFRISLQKYFLLVVFSIFFFTFFLLIFLPDP